MVTLSHFVVKLFGGAPLIEMQLKARKKRLPLDLDTSVRFVETLLSDTTNRWIILGQWWKQEQSGMVPGIIIETDCLCLSPRCKFCVKGVIKVKQMKRTQGDGNARANKS